MLLKYVLLRIGCDITCTKPTDFMPKTNQVALLHPHHTAACQASPTMPMAILVFLSLTEVTSGCGS